MQKERITVLGLIASSFFILLPVLLVVLVFQKFYMMMRTMIRSLLDALPGKVFHDPMIRGLAVFVAIVALLLLVGLLAHTRMGRAIGRELEAAFLKRLPFYTLLRNFALGLAGKEDEHSLKTVLVTVKPGMQQLGLLVERHADGSGTVFFPSAPNPASGSILVVEGPMICELHVPAHRLFQCLSRWGDGTATMLEMARKRTAEIGVNVAEKKQIK